MFVRKNAKHKTNKKKTKKKKKATLFNFWNSIVGHRVYLDGYNGINHSPLISWNTMKLGANVYGNLQAQKYVTIYYCIIYACFFVFFF